MKEKIKQIVNKDYNKIIKEWLKVFFIICSMFILPSLFQTIIISFKIIKSEVIISLISTFIYMIILFIIYRKSIVEEFKIFKSDLKNNIKIGFKMWGIGLILMMFSNFIINVILFNGSIASNEELNRELISKFPVYSMISAIIFAPFIEEIIFRKSFKDIIKNKKIYFILSGMLFGLAHISTEIVDLVKVLIESGFLYTIKEKELWLNLLYIIPYGALGYAFAMAYDKTKSIFTSMFIHLIHNTFTLSLLIIFNNLL